METRNIKKYMGDAEKLAATQKKSREPDVKRNMLGGGTGKNRWVWGQKMKIYGGSLLQRK